jgi:Bacteriophage CI repressor helix-turn-helix domain.
MKDRIKKIMDQEGLTPFAFADVLDINRQTLTATLSRNKTASINIVMAILEKYPDINTDWLLFGKGSIYKGDKTYLQPQPSSVQPSLFDENTEINPTPIQQKNEYREESIVKPIEKEEQNLVVQRDIPIKIEGKEIDKIMVFYSDKTFITLVPEE